MSNQSVEISEAQFERQVKDAARLFGWLFYHTQRSQWSPAGFPDCVMVKGDRIIYAELKKNAKSKPSPEQREWLWALAAAGAEVYLWTPNETEQMVKSLRGGSR